MGTKIQAINFFCDVPWSRSRGCNTNTPVTVTAVLVIFPVRLSSSS